jgi:hypothetical protein
MIISTYMEVYGKILGYSNGIVIYMSKVCKIFGRYFNVFGRYTYVY